MDIESIKQQISDAVGEALVKIMPALTETAKQAAIAAAVAELQKKREE